MSYDIRNYGAAMAAHEREKYIEYALDAEEETTSEKIENILSLILGIILTAAMAYGIWYYFIRHLWGQ